MTIKDKEMAIIITTIHKYINVYNGRDFINYYDLFGIDSNLSIEEINNYLRQNRYRVLFHPDFINNIPEHLRSFYPEICECYKIFCSTIDTPAHKKAYDNKVRQNTQQKYNNQENYDYTVTGNPEQELSELKENVFQIFGKFLLPTCARYGTKFCNDAIQSYISNGNINGFTRTQGTRSKIASFDRKIILEKINLAYPNITGSALADAIIEDSASFSNQILTDATAETYAKYGPAQARYALSKLAKEDEVAAFTNHNTRQQLKNTEISSITFKFIMAKELGLDVDEYVYIANVDNSVNDYFQKIEAEIHQQQSYSFH